MTDEENRLENTQASTADATEGAERMSSEGASNMAGQPAEADSELSSAWQDIVLEDEPEATTTAASGSMSDADRAALTEMANLVESLKGQLEERTNQYMRIAADFDNFRRRTQKEKEDLEPQIKCSTLVELLPVVDNFERARSQIKPQNDGEMNIHKSYQSVYKQLVESLKRIGVSPMRSEGKEFDPNLHEAVMREATEDYAEGTVIEELVRGYLLGERVLRHAMVKVAAAPEPMVSSGGDNPEETNS